MLTREKLVRWYVTYDRTKKGKPIPDMDAWDWTNADALDAALRSSGLKYGVIVGYREWEPRLLKQADLAKCKIVSGIKELEDLPKVLGALRDQASFLAWRPDRSTDWYDALQGGAPIEWDRPLILRPARASENADWYVEDGSGRALCFYRRLLSDGDASRTAAAYIGSNPDETSSFMKSKFPDLLGRR